MTAHALPFLAKDRIDLAREAEFDLGGLKVRPAELRVVRNGTEQELQPRVMQVLIALAKKRPNVVSRDLIIECCWDGRIVGDDALNRCILALRHVAQQFSPPPFSIQTVPRIGHRLIENGHNPEVVRGSGRSRRALWIAVASALLLLAIAAGSIFWFERSAPDDSREASIAVLPFRNLGAGDPYFAEGVGEEILGELAREPQFHVAGSSFASRPGVDIDAQQFARRLRVDYVLEGTVRQQGDLVRVNAHLLRASDGTRLWSDSYDGRLDDIFAIQRKVGTAIAQALKRKLVTLPLTGPLVTKGKAYNLYLTARGLIRSRNRRAGPMAVELLREALDIDPNYAPAWASLGEATLMAGALGDEDRFAAAAAQAQRYARHAVELAPDLPEAHRALGTLIGFGNPEALVHLRRAAELDPGDAENLIGLGAAYAAAGEFEKELAAYRRAAEADPLWFRPVAAFAVAEAEMGEVGKAQAIVRNAMPANDRVELQMVMGKVALATGDYSEAFRLWSAAARSGSPRWSNTAQRRRMGLAQALGFNTGDVPRVPSPLDQRRVERVRTERPPSKGEWRKHTRDAVAAAVFRDQNLADAKWLARQGRWRELIAAYDGPGGMASIRRGERLRADQLGEAPGIIAALRAAGRKGEAERRTGEALQLLSAIDRHGRVPNWFDAEAAAVLGAAGQTDQALQRLQRAIDRGWRHGGITDAPDIKDEPGLAELSGNSTFEAVRRAVAAHNQQERREIAASLR